MTYGNTAKRSDFPTDLAGKLHRHYDATSMRCGERVTGKLQLMRKHCGERVTSFLQTGKQWVIGLHNLPISERQKDISDM